MTARPPRGIALPVVILLLLSLTVLGHGALLLAQAALKASRASADDLQSRLAAESGVRKGMEILAGRPVVVDRLSWGEVVRLYAAGPAPGSRFHVGVRRLGPELFLLESTGWREGVPTRRRIGRVVWLLDPLTRVAAVGGVVEYGGDLHSTTSVGSHVVIPAISLEDDPEGWCTDHGVEIDSILSHHRPVPAKNVGSGLLDSGRPGLEDSRVPPGLGLWEGNAVMRAANRLSSGTVSPSASFRGGRCLTEEPANWGSPSDPGGPCGSYRPLLGVEGSLTMSGGEGQGILLVAGDLHMNSGAHFSGIVLVGGQLHLSSGARISGFARVEGSILLADPTHIRFSPCAGLLALEANREVAGVVPVPDGSWVLPF